MKIFISFFIKPLITIYNYFYNFFTGLYLQLTSLNNNLYLFEIFFYLCLFLSDYFLCPALTLPKGRELHS